MANEPRDPHDSDPQGESTHAADEPTAVWDMEALRKAGLSEIAQLPEQPETGPATPADGMVARRASVIVDDDKGAAAAAGAAAREAAPAPVAPVRARPAPGAGNQGMSWVSLIALAALFGTLAYAAIRFLR